MPWHRLRRLRRCWVTGILIIACATSAARAEPRATLSDGRLEEIEFRTYTPASQRPLILRTYLNEPAVVISGILSLPANAPLQREGKIPAVVIAHGIGGISGGARAGLGEAAE